MPKNTKLFVAVLTTIYLVKSAWPIELMFDITDRGGGWGKAPSAS